MDKPGHQARSGQSPDPVGTSHQRSFLSLPSRRRFRQTFWTALFVLLSVVAGSWAMAAKYVYDGNGRLVVVTNEAGQSARYVYDKLGNLLRIDRLAADELAVFAFSPSRGAVGASVTIQGQGFGVAPQVAFNGTTATVTSVSPTELLAQVPAGATTGPLTVIAGSQMVAGPVDFVVDENAQPPVITDINPLIVSAGTAVTVTGARLYPVPDQTRVALNGRLAFPTAITNTQLTFPVPTKTGSGKVSATTLYGTAISTQDVIVAPDGIATGDIVASGRLLIDGPAQSLSASASNQRVALLIDGEAGLMSSLQFSNLSGSISYTLYGPNNVSVASGGVSATSPSVHLPRLTAATYLLLMKPSTVPASWNVALERNKVVTVDGDVVVIPSTASYQSKRLVFSAAPGQKLGLGVSDFAIGGTTGGSSSIYVYDATGTQVGYQTCYQSYNGCDINLLNLAGGTYTALVQSPGSGNNTISFKATLSSEVVATLQADAAYALNLSRRGQNGRLAFVAAAGQTVALRVGAQTTVPANNNVYYTVYKPDGSVLQSTVYSANGTLNLPNLPVSGTYAIFVDPYYGSTVSAQTTLVSGVADTMDVDGQVRAYATATTGQNAYLTFTATTGQNLGLGLSDFVINGATSGYSQVYVYRADGTQLAYQYCYPSNGGCEINLPNLMGGTYSVVVLAPTVGNGTMSFKAALSSDVTATLQPDAVFDLALARRGQNGRLSFAGAAGQTVALRIANQVTAPSNLNAYYTVYRPDGSLLQSVSLTPSGALNLPNLPTSGTYSVFVDPYYGATATMQLTLASGVTGTAIPDGEVRSYATTTAEQNAYFTFTATAGQNLGLGLSELVTPGTTSYVTVQVYRPDGSSLATEYCYASNNGCDVNLSNLMGGTYQVTVTPPTSGNRTMSFQTTLSADISAGLEPNVPYGMNLARRGQNGRLSFTAMAGQSIALSIMGQATVPTNRTVTYFLYKPDGSLLQSDNTTTATTLIANNLPASGTYLLYVDPNQGEATTAQVTLSQGVKVESTLEIDGASRNVATQVTGQNAYFSFTATPGQNLGLGISDLATPGTTSYTTVYIYRPDGSQLAYEYCYAANGGCDMNLPMLAGGTYSVLVIPPSNGARTMSFQTTLSSDTLGALPSGVAYNLTLGRRGQNGRLTFDASAGQTATLNVSSQSTVPANRSVYYTVYKPDGSVLQSDSTATTLASVLNNLPVDGTYQLYVDPGFGETATAQVFLSQGIKAEGALAVDGASQGFTTQVPGQNVYFSFVATPGQNLGLGLSDLVTPGATGYVGVYVYRPDGSQAVYDNCYASNNGCDLNLPSLMGGTYRVMVVAPGNGDRTMSFQATVSTDIVGTLEPNTAYNLNLARRGQNARLTLLATAGQTATLSIAGQATNPANRTVYYTVYKPDGSLLQNSGLSTSGTVNLTTLPMSGAYTVLVDPYQGETLTAQLTQSGASGTAISPTSPQDVPVDGSATGFSTQTAGQSVTFTFTANAGQDLGLGISDLVTPGASTWDGAYVTVYRLDGTSLTSINCYASNNGCDLNLPNAMGGTYKAVVTPASGGTRTMSFQATVSADVTGVLQPGVAYNLNLARRGQNGRLTFTANQGQSVTLGTSAQSTQPSGRNVTYAIYKPDGGLLQSTVTTSTLSWAINNLPMSGTYVAFVDPYYGATATTQLQLSQADKVEDTLDATTKAYATQAAGQNAYFSFTATAGQNLGLGISDLTTPGAAYWDYAQVTVYRPDGTQVASESCYATNNGCDLNLSNLSAGTHRVVMTPPGSGARTMNFKATVSADLEATLQPDVAYSLNLSRPGQNGRLTFTAAAGQTITLNVSGQATVPANRSVYFTIYKPDGTSLQSGTSSTSGLNLIANNLPMSGTYRVFVDPNQGETATALITLSQGAKAENTLEVDGTVKSVATQVWGQSAYLTFTAAPGQNLGLGLSDFAIGGTTSGSTQLYVYRADGSQLTYQNCSMGNGGCDINFLNMMGGTYNVVVLAPDYGNRTMSFKATLSSEVTATLQPGATYDLALSRRGQNGRLAFTATTGQAMALRIANQTTTPTGNNVYYTVYKPDGSVLQSSVISSGTPNGTMNFANLPASGIYTIFVDPYYGAAVNAQVTLASGVTGAVIADGDSQSFATTTADQNVYFTFTAATGQNLGLGLSDLVTPGGSSSVAVYVYRADGTQLVYQYCSPSYNGCDLDLPNLMGGTYSVVAYPPGTGDRTMSFQVTLSGDQEASLQPDVAYGLNLARRGQNGRLMFAGTAGQSRTLNISGQTTVPADQAVSYIVYKPDGSLLQSSTVTASGTLTMALPASGTYSVWVDPNYAASESAQITLH